MCMSCWNTQSLAPTLSNMLSLCMSKPELAPLPLLLTYPCTHGHIYPQCSSLLPPPVCRCWLCIPAVPVATCT
jgi:hypothetical protein